MKSLRVAANSVSTASGDNPDWMALVASSETETVEVVFETMKAPLLAASLLASSQEACSHMAPSALADGLARHSESAAQILPEALDIRLAANGDVLCVNVGSGVLFFKLAEAAKQKLKKF